MRETTGVIDETSGAIVELFIGVDGPRTELLKKHNLPVPPLVAVRAQIDTGAAVSGISPEVLKQLDLTPIGKRSIITPSTGPNPHQCDEYVVSVRLLHPEDGGYHPTVPVIETYFLEEENVGALLGRDLLASCTFLYRGPERSFHFGWSKT